MQKIVLLSDQELKEFIQILMKIPRYIDYLEGKGIIAMMNKKDIYNKLFNLKSDKPFKILKKENINIIAGTEDVEFVLSNTTLISEVVNLISTLNKLAKESNSKNYINLDVISREYDIPYDLEIGKRYNLKNIQQVNKTDINIKDCTMIIKKVSVGKILSLSRLPRWVPIDVYEYKPNKYIILDGYHRFVSRVINGNETIFANIKK